MTRGNYKVQDVEISKHAERDTSYRTCILSLFIFLILCIIIVVIAWTTWKPLSGMTEIYLHQDRPEGGHYTTISRINDITTESNPRKTTKRLHVDVGTTRHSPPTTARTNFSKLLPPSTNNRTKQSNVKLATKLYTRSTTSSNIFKTNPFPLSQTTPPSTFGNDSTTYGHHMATSSILPNDTIVYIIDNSSVVTPTLNITSPIWNNSVHSTDQFNVTKILLPNITITKMLVSETIVRTSQAARNILTTPATATNNTYEDSNLYDRLTDVTDRYHHGRSYNVQSVDDTSTTLDATTQEPSTEFTKFNIFTSNVTDHPFLNTTQHKINVESNISPSSPKDVTSSIFVLSELQTDITNITRTIAHVVPTVDITKFREATTINEGEGETVTSSFRAMNVLNTTENETITRFSESIYVINTTGEIIMLSTESIDNTNNTEEETITRFSEPIDVINTTGEITIFSTESIDATNNIEEEIVTLSSEPIDVSNTTEEISIFSTESINATNIEEEIVTLSSEPIDVSNASEKISIFSTESIDATNNIEEEIVTLSSEPIDVSNTTEEISIFSTESIDATNNTEEETVTLSSEPIDVINTTEEISIFSTESIDSTNSIEEETISLSSGLIDVTVTTEEDPSSESMKVTVVTPIGDRKSTIVKSSETYNSNAGSENKMTTIPAVFSVNASISRNSTL